MKNTLLLIAIVALLLLGPRYLAAQSDSAAPKVPFDGMDLTWVNGQSRQKDFPLNVNDKMGKPLLSASAYIDSYFNYNLANPIDNTHNVSSSVGRHKEITLNLVSVGMELYRKGAFGRILLQFGNMQHIVQELDPSVNRGRNTGAGNQKFLREAAVGYHFNKWYGVNVEAGIFMSYMGLESYLLQDNWNYQRSMVCEFTPFYFQGVRAQIYPAKKYKLELWLMNGWQSYNSFALTPSIGCSHYLRPHENLQFAANFYLGHDTYGPDTLGNQSRRLRFHHDHSVVARYFKRPEAKFLSQMAVSVNNHYGFEDGNDAADLTTPKTNFMVGTSIANRFWFYNNRLALTLRGDVLSNGGGYLAFVPSLVTPNAYTDAFAADPKHRLAILQGTATFDIMPNDNVTLRVEYGHRRCNHPYFSGHGGVTSPSGWVGGPGTVNPWRPDLKRTENRVTVAVNFRI